MKILKWIKINKYFLYTLLVVFLFFGCGEWKEDYDFRNYVRDLHPYSVITKIDLNGLYDYKVTDTIKKEIWVYTTYRSKSSIKRIKINCY